MASGKFRRRSRGRLFPGSRAPADRPGADVDGLVPADRPGADVDGLVPADRPGADVDGLVPADRPGAEACQSVGVRG